MIKPDEIKIPEFAKGFKGYNAAEVDEFIQSLIAEYSELFAKNKENEQKLSVLAEKYKQASGRATEAMNGVKQMSEAIIADAQAEGEKIIADANAKAAAVTGAMKSSCAEILEGYANTFEVEKQKLVAMEEKSKAFREFLLEAYKNHIADIQGEFPAVSADEIMKVSFETQVAPLFKDKLENKKPSEDVDL